MNRFLLGFVAIVFFATPVLAQTPDPDFLQKAIVSLQTQRNNALDAQAVASAQVQQLSEKVTALQAKVDELQKKSDDKPVDTPDKAKE